MEIKILQVFLGADGLPYKDQGRTVHFPIVGSGFQGASNTTKIRFYYDELVEQDDTETAWVACAKLPNGKIGSKVLETDYDSTLGEHYALLELDSFYFQYKGDVYISLQGYQGGVQVSYDEETELYTINGTPTIAATGSIKLSVNCATQFVGSGETSNVNFQRILADLGTKLGIRAQSEHVEELPSVGQNDIFYVVNDDPDDPNLQNIYVWNENTQSYVWVGDNTLDLGNYYTKEQGEQFESDIDNRVESVENELSSVASGSPKGVYATLAALQAAYPTGTNGIYVVSADGHWYYWSGSAWIDGGVYLSAVNVVTHTGNQLKDDQGNNIFPYISHQKAYLVLGTINIDTVNLSITSNGAQYVYNGSQWNYAINNQTISYTHNDRPNFLFVHITNKTLHCYNYTDNGSDLTNAQNNGQYLLLCVFYNNKVIFNSSPSYISLNGVISSNLVYNATHYPCVSLSNNPDNIYQKSFLNIVLTKYTTKNLALYRIFKNAQAGANVVYSVALRNLDNNTDILLLNVLASNYTETKVNYFSVGGFQGYFEIDWSAIPNQKIVTLGDYPKLLPICFVEDMTTSATHFPFVGYSSSSDAPKQKALLNIYFDKYPTKDVGLWRIFRNAQSGANIVYVIQIRNNSTNQIINILNVLSSGYTEKKRNYFNEGGFQGYFDIDWSIIPDQTIATFGDYPKFLPICFSEDGEYLDAAIPANIPVVVNREIRLEYYNMYKCTDIESYDVFTNTNTGDTQNIQTAFKIKATSVGTGARQLTLRRNNQILMYNNFNIVAVSDATKPNIKAIFIGDSFTDAGYYLAELKTLMGDNLTLYGTRTSTAKNSNNVDVTTNDEGRSSWSSSDYVGLASKSGVSNPFYNDGFDFSYYITNNPTYSDVTDVFILLGPNDGSSSSFLTNIQTMCNSIKSYNSSIKIHIMLPLPPIRSGYAWGIRNNNSVVTFKEYMFKHAKDLIATFDGVSGYSVIATNLNVDCWYDFPRTEVPANMRNPELIEVGNDNVHPNRYGYYRMADMIYADIIKNS